MNLLKMEEKNMYGVVWDKESGGVKLLKSSNRGLVSVRPVFHEELNLLGLNEYWGYPEVDEPLLWAVGREYFYKGKPVAKVNGGGFFEKPKVKLYAKKLVLEPVDVNKMLEHNREILEPLIHDTLDEINKTYLKYRNKVDSIVVAFSGGKDSTVLLDLVQRMIPPEDFVVVFNDTTMELSATYKYVELIKKKYSPLKFYVAKFETLAPKMWQEAGIPSRVHRWCCTVYKTVPTVKLIRELTGKEFPVILLYDGVRAEESKKRANLSPISEGKYLLQKNFHPILYWNSAEVYLYMFLRKLPFNMLYRWGARRVGCAVCPFSSKWWEFIVGMKFADEVKEYLEIISDYVKKKGITDPEEIREFINKGDWKARVGGRVLQSRDKVAVIKKDQELRVIVQNPKENYLEWLKIVGDVTSNNSSITLKVSNKVYEFKWEIYSNNVNNGTIFILKSMTPINLIEDKIQHYLKVVGYKSAHCVHCKTCEIVCPANAISMDSGKVVINESKCTHCYKCLTFANRGCIVADSLKVGIEVRGMKGLGKYKHFPLKKVWLEDFFQNPEEWWVRNNLGTIQFEAMRLWLMDSEIIESKSKKYFEFTKLGRTLREIGVNSAFTWMVIWANLSRNSPIISWYIRNLSWGRTYNRKELLEKLGANISDSTKKNGIQSLIGLFAETPLGDELELGILVKKGKRVMAIEKRGLTKKVPIKDMLLGVLYTLYSYAEQVGRYNFTVSELYEESAIGGPYKIFRINRQELEKLLRGLSEKFGREWISVELVADLDNITLNSKKSREKVVELYLSD